MHYPMTYERCDVIKTLGDFPTTSTKYMTKQERLDGIATMLDDLERLAKEDGCVAAGWALEFLTEIEPVLSDVKGNAK